MLRLQVLPRACLASTNSRAHVWLSALRTQRSSYHAERRPIPLKLPAGHSTLLPLVLSCSNLVLQEVPGTIIPRYIVGSRTEDGSVHSEETVVPFLLSNPGTSPNASPEERRPVGFLRKEVTEAIVSDHTTSLFSELASPWDVQYSASSRQTGTLPESISFAPWVNMEGETSRTKHIQGLVKRWRSQGMFADILRGWSDEAYPIFHHAPRLHEPKVDPVAFTIERAALPLFGFANFGCLLNAFYISPDTGKTRMWIPRRSMTKRTWPGKLDVTVGGGMGVGDTAEDTIVRECVEEASLDANYVRENVRPVGVLPFPNRSPAHWLLPGMYYLFDLPLPPDGTIAPRTNAADGEVESFELMDADTVLHHLVEGRFKASSALAIVDFLIRHGLVTDRTDSRYTNLCRLLKREFILPVPWR
ncbi:putative protein with domain of unknown function (DUF4743) [Lyophyllum shimeji]|uniref:Nudix hydrolase domain-containing protein n=1 Tax=Lyophyllum shimeji TaxID=47721 RepID=A0A9P3PS89_LYOSH|nr:putative protein with domain of unknown function (DUF4743) [Lyophyllum shimeji]